MPYRIALFDADNTLLDFTRSEREAVRICLAARGLPTDVETASLYSNINDKYWKRLEQGLITRDRLKVERFADFFTVLGYDGDPRRMASDYEAALSHQSFLLDGALDLIRSLHGYCRLFIITNGTASVQKGRFGGCTLAPYFEACFISEEMGSNKPEKKFFDDVASSISDFDPRETIVIGDSLSSDIRGGINAGLDTCWYNPSGKVAPADMNITYIVRSLNEISPILLS